MKLFFSCDWGTSMFRLRLVDAVDARILSEIKTGYGIATAFESWKQNGQDPNERISFYQAYLGDQLKKMATSFDVSLANAPVVLSGMASSSIGMLELPYKNFPFRCDGSDLVLHTIPSRQNMPSQIIISGVRSEADVIRGEETILAGCEIEADDKEQLFILPGTHSKHITVKDGWVKNVTTYMTGELFDLLSNKSILSASVKKDVREQNHHDGFFAEGVMKGLTSKFLNSIFHVRTNQLFGKASPEQNYQHLSGLLIGHELKELSGNSQGPVTLVCGTALKKAYMIALEILELSSQLQYKDADVALINGQRKIMDRVSY
ncbi:MAG TPA: 2-dehydro-3-deoxygalactonokinase [Chitinophagaceae bacterium]|nr:2-dehydro-3-deoxygalactonokinase [Chitinophagaceae bacterium]